MKRFCHKGLNTGRDIKPRLNQLGTHGGESLASPRRSKPPISRARCDHLDAVP